MFGANFFAFPVAHPSKAPVEGYYLCTHILYRPPPKLPLSAVRSGGTTRNNIYEKKALAFYPAKPQHLASKLFIEMQACQVKAGFLKQVFLRRRWRLALAF